MEMNLNQMQVGGYSSLMFHSCVGSQFLFKLFGWNTHNRIFSVFLLHVFLSLCLDSSPADSLGLRVLALLTHSVLKFYVCFRYFEDLVI